MMQTKQPLLKPGRSFSIFLALLTALVAACDILDPDSKDTDSQLQIRNESIIITPKSSGIIDLNSLITSSGNHRIQVATQPRLGKLESLGDNLLQYIPNEGITEGRDGFTFSVFAANNVFVGEDSVTIVITQDTTSHSCSLYSLDDYVSNVDSVVIIDVLANDSACNVSRSQLTVSHHPVEIFPNASYGTAVFLSDGRLKYTPAANYRGSDIVYYQVIKPANIPNVGDPEEFSYARVFISGPAPCDSLVVRNDYYSVSLDTVLIDSIPPVTIPVYDTLRIYLTDNDVWCNDSLPAITIIEEPEGHLVGYGLNPQTYFYTRPPTAVAGDRDRFRYRLCVGSRCGEAEVFINYR